MKSPFAKFLPFWLFIILFKISSAIYSAVLPVLGEMVMPIWAVGMVISVASFIQLPFDLVAGIVLEKRGYLKSLLICTAAFVFAGGIFIFGLTTTTFLVSVLISIIAWMFFTPAVNSYILSHSSRSSSEKMILWRDSFQSVGIVLGTTALPLILILDPKISGLIMAVIFIVALIFASISPKDEEKISDSEKKIDTQHYYIVRRDYLGSLRHSLDKLDPVGWILAFQGVVSTTFYSTIWFVIPLAIADNIKNLPSLSLGIFDIAIVSLGFVFGAIAKKAHKKTLIILGLLIFAVMTAFLGHRDGWMFLIFGFFATIGDELSGVSLWTWMSHLDKDHTEDSKVAGVITFFQDIGWSIGPLMAGILYSTIGIEWTITITAIPIFIVFFFALYKTRSLPKIHHHHHPYIRKPHYARHKH